MSRFLRACGRTVLALLRAGFLLLLLLVPVPVGELFHKLFETRRKNEAAKVVKKDEPD